MENGARLEILKDGVCDSNTEVGRGGTQEEGACGVASQDRRWVGGKTEPVEREPGRVLRMGASTHGEGVILRSRPGPRAISVISLLDVALF